MSENDAVGSGRGSRAGRWLAWTAIVVVVGLVAAAAVMSGRPELALAAAAGLLLAWLLRQLTRALRRRRWVVVGIAGALLLAVCVTAPFLLFFAPSAPGPPPGAQAVGSVTVRYHAEGEVQDDAVTIHEELVMDDSALAAVTRTLGSKAPVGGVRQDQLTLADWQPSTPVDGFATFERTRSLAPGEATLVSSRVRIPVDLGQLTVRTDDGPLLVRLDPRDGSTIEIAAAKGAIGTTYPAAAAVTDRLRAGRQEVATFNVDRDVDEVAIAVLGAALRNPAGKTLYEAIVWGPLPWLIGAVFLLFTSLIGDKIKQLLGWTARRAIRAGRGDPDGSPPDGSPPDGSPPDGAAVREAR